MSMMHRIVARVLVLILVCSTGITWNGCCTAAEDVLSENSSEIDSRLMVVEDFILQHCVGCHSGPEDDRAGGLDLESFDFTSHPWTDRKFESDVWEAILKRTTARQMPPAGEDRPSEAEYEAATSALNALLRDRASEYPRLAPTESLRRLTRTEYQNSIRDLLGVPIDATTLLPPDESSHGFDNITVGELSPMLMSRYVSAAQGIARTAVGRMDAGPIGLTVRVPADRTQADHVEGLPFGTRGGTAFEHHFAAAGEYEIELRLTRDRDEMVEGLTEPHQIDVLIDDTRMHRFTVKPPPGRKDFTHVDSNLRTRIEVSRGTHRVGVTFPRKGSSLSETKRQPFDASYNRHRHPRSEPAIFQVSLIGPLAPRGKDDAEADGSTKNGLKKEYPFGDDSSGQRNIDDLIFACRVDDDASAEQRRECGLRIVRDLARRAYRRPLTEDDLRSPMFFFDEGDREGGFDAGVESCADVDFGQSEFSVSDRIRSGKGSDTRVGKRTRS